MEACCEASISVPRDLCDLAFRLRPAILRFQPYLVGCKTENRSQTFANFSLKRALALMEIISIQSINI